MTLADDGPLSLNNKQAQIPLVWGLHGVLPLKEGRARQANGDIWDVLVLVELWLGDISLCSNILHGIEV